MRYVIIQDSRKDEGMFICLKNRVKETDTYWTSYFEYALMFDSKEAAIERVSKLKYNNPRVVPEDEAKSLIKEIYQEVIVWVQKKKRRKSIFEMDMYEYKEWLGGGNDDWSEFDGGSGQTY